MKAVVIGAGMAGLSTAIALKLKGIDVEIHEGAKSLTEIGAGLQLSPNGMKVMEYLGIELEEEFEPEWVMMRMGRTGREIFSIPLKYYAIDRWGAVFFHIHRADLQKCLVKRARSLKIPIELGKPYNQTQILALKEKLAAENGYLIGADGVHSEARQAIFKNSKAKFSGNVAYRALIPLSDLQSPPASSAVIWAGRRQHAVTTRVRYGELINFVGVCEEKDWREIGWNHPVDAGFVQEKFKNWHPTIHEILKKADDFNRWALLSLPPLPSYYQDNLVLVGDAAHPVLPSFAQGAVQAFEDAYILAECLTRGSLEDFNRLRRARVEKVERASRANMRHYHYGPIGRTLYYSGAWILDKIWRNSLIKQLDWLYEYDVRSEAESYFSAPPSKATPSRYKFSPR